MIKGRKFWLFHSGFWVLAGSMLFASGLAQAPFHVAATRNIYLAVMGFVVGLAFTYLYDRAEGWEFPKRILLALGASYVVGMACTVLINPITFGQLGVAFGDMGFRQIFAGVLNYALVLTLWSIFYMSWFQRKAPQDSSHALKDVPETLTVSKGRQNLTLAPDRIDWISAAGDYVEVHSSGQCYLKRATMTSMAEALPSENFIRVHRSLIVRKTAVEAVEAQSKGEYWLVLAGGVRLKTGRSYRAAIRESLL